MRRVLVFAACFGSRLGGSNICVELFALSCGGYDAATPPVLKPWLYRKSAKVKPPRLT